MTVFKYYSNGFNLKEKEIDKDAPLKRLVVSVLTVDLDNCDDEENPKMVSFKQHRGKTLQEAVDIFKEQYNTYESKAIDWKGHSLGALKFYWQDEQERNVLTIVKLLYCGNEISEFDVDELNFG